MTLNVEGRIDVDAPDGAWPTVVDRLDQQIAGRSGAIAIVTADGEGITYGALGRRTARIAAGLLERGVRPGDVVAYEAVQSPLGVMTMIGIMRAGCAALPLSLGDPSDRVQAALHDASAVVAVAGEGIPLPAACARASADELERSPAPVSLPRTAPSDPAYVLLTSGSTGRPKGVVMPHLSLTRLVQWHLDHDPASPRRRTAQLAALTFDVSQQEIFATLCAGGTLVLLDDGARRDTDRLAQLIADLAVDRLFLPTALLQPLAESGLRSARELPLRDVMVAGSALRISPSIRAWFAGLPGCRLHNHYGPTETHVVVAHTLDDDPAAWPDVPPIGRPLPHAEVAVLGPDGAPVPDGERGELVVGGACLSAGYVGRPELTAQRFRRDDEGARRYWTGDIVSSHDGHLHFHGRADRQVKVRGFRVEPAAIESTLAAASGVMDCAVVPEGGGPTAERLVAYVVADGAWDGAARVDGEQWAAHLRTTLPDHMVPSVWIRLTALPTTRHGKLDHAALPEPPGHRPVLAVGYVEPAGPSERRVSRLFQALLGLDAVGADDSFFALGGTSLAATKLAAALADEAGRDVGVEVVLREQTVRDIARVLDTRPATPRRAPTSGAADARPSHVQLRFLVAELLSPGSPANIVVSAHHLGACPSVPALRAAVADVCARHRELSARFDLTGERLPDAAPADVAVLDVTTVTDAAMAVAEAEQRRPFDLAERAVRFQLAELPDGSTVFTLAAHHVVIDGWSEVVLLEDLSHAYRARAEGRVPTWSSTPAPYAELVAEEAAWLGSDEAAQQRAWWARKLEAVADAPWPAAAPDAPFETLTVTVPAPAGPAPAVVGQLTALGRALQDRLVVCDDVGVGVVVSGRHGHRFSRTVGPFINTVSVPVALGAGRYGTDRCAPALFEALARARLPFDEVVAATGRRGGVRHPLCQALLIPQSYEEVELVLPECSSTRIPVAPEPRPFEVVVTTWRAATGLAARFDVALGAGFAEGLADAWRSALADRPPFA